MNYEFNKAKIKHIDNTFKSCPRMAAWCISFFGIQPTLTQVPPSPHVVPIGVGFTKSQTATLAPSLAASFDEAKPPEPPPMTIFEIK